MKINITAEMGYAYVTANATQATATFENNKIDVGRGMRPCNILFASNPGTINLMIDFISGIGVVARLEFSWGQPGPPAIAKVGDAELEVNYSYNQSTETTTITLTP